MSGSTVASLLALITLPEVHSLLTRRVKRDHLPRRRSSIPGTVSTSALSSVIPLTR
jgi:hypothetical protein